METENETASHKPPSPPSPEGPAGLIGAKVSHYRVLEFVGAGGMGMIYKAEDLKLARRVPSGARKALARVSLCRDHG